LKNSDSRLTQAVILFLTLTAIAEKQSIEKPPVNFHHRNEKRLPSISSTHLN